MALGTNFHAREALRTVAAVGRAMRDAATSERLPLLVIRLPELERIAWRHGKRAAHAERAAARAFYNAVGSCLRSEDLLGHDVGSDVFVVAMLALGRNHTQPLPWHCRLVLKRVAATMSLAANENMETGWILTRAGEVDTSLVSEIAAALKRGRLERERFDFFATVGHELRTPLTSIRGYLETLLQADCDASTSRRFLETAQGEALRLGRLVDGMFEYSLLDMRPERLWQKGCDPNLAIRAASRAVAPMAAHRSVSIDLLDAVACTVAMDADACIQTLINVVDNAIRHGREGGRIVISSSSQAGFVRIAVDDDGAGVCETERNAIFEFRIRGSSEHAQGSGIGLTIARQLVERAGGEIRVADSALGGARFEMLLPAQAESLLPTS